MTAPLGGFRAVREAIGLHECEVQLVFRASSGAVLPTSDFDRLAITAPGAAHVLALRDQAKRQSAALLLRGDSHVG